MKVSLILVGACPSLYNHNVPLLPIAEGGKFSSNLKPSKDMGQVKKGKTMNQEIKQEHQNRVDGYCSVHQRKMLRIDRG